MSEITVNRALLDEYAKKVSPQAIVLYLTLATFADETTREAAPSIRKLCEKLGKQARAIQLSLRELEENGLIITTPRKNEDGGPISNSYKLLV